MLHGHESVRDYGELILKRRPSRMTDGGVEIVTGIREQDIDAA